MRFYSVASFGVTLTIKPRQTNTQCYRVIITGECFNSTRSIEGRDPYLTEIISDFGELVTSSTATEFAAIITKFLLSQIY